MSRLSFLEEQREMLVLSRKEGERLVIGDDVVITVTKISGNRITLGIDAPRDVRVTRGELERHDSTAEKRVSGHVGGCCGESCNRIATFEVDLGTFTERVAG